MEANVSKKPAASIFRRTTKIEPARFSKIDILEEGKSSSS